MKPEMENGLERVIEEIAIYDDIIMGLEHDTGDLSPIHLEFAKMVQGQHKKTVQCVLEGTPLAASYFCNALEIFTALDIHWYHIVGQTFGAGINPHSLEDLEAMDKLPVGSDVCTLLRLGLYYLDAGLLPKPTMLVPMITPCDGIIGMHEAIRRHKKWRGIPTFALDSPYYNDDRSIDYFANELRELIRFLEAHTGKKMDWDRLREVVEVTNEYYRLWAEYNELRRSVPCPHGHILAMASMPLAQTAGAGDPARCDTYRAMIANAETRIRENNPEVPNQKIRVLWYDLQPIWFDELAPWMEQEWCVCVVLCMFSDCPHNEVDLSTEDTILKGLAERNLLYPAMVRQARGVADNFLSDIERIVRDYQVDCVILPGHMGHKDGSASISLMREKCREIGVPFLVIGCDQFDKRYTTIDEMKDKISQFFTAMGLG